MINRILNPVFYIIWFSIRNWTTKASCIGIQYYRTDTFGVFFISMPKPIEFYIITMYRFYQNTSINLLML